MSWFSCFMSFNLFINRKKCYLSNGRSQYNNFGSNASWKRDSNRFLLEIFSHVLFCISSRIVLYSSVDVLQNCVIKIAYIYSVSCNPLLERMTLLSELPENSDYQTNDSYNLVNSANWKHTAQTLRSDSLANLSWFFLVNQKHIAFAYCIFYSVADWLFICGCVTDTHCQ